MHVWAEVMTADVRHIGWIITHKGLLIALYFIQKRSALKLC